MNLLRWSPALRSLLACRAESWSALLGKAVRRVTAARAKGGSASSQVMWRVELAEGTLAVRGKATTAYEAQVYRLIADRSPVEIPRLLYSEVHDPHGFLIYEALPPGTPPENWSPVEERLVLTALARLHAAFWDDRLPPGALVEDLRVALERDLPLVRRGLAALRQIGGWPGVIDLHTLTNMDRLAADPARLLSPLAQMPLTLLHADAWQPNWVLLPDRQVLLDWQTAAIGPAVWDVVYLLEMSGEVGGKLPLPVDDAVSCYLNALESALGRPIPHERAAFLQSMAAVSVIQTLTRWPRFALDYLQPVEKLPALALLWRVLPLPLRRWISEKTAWTSADYYQQVFKRFNERVDQIY